MTVSPEEARAELERRRRERESANGVTPQQARAELDKRRAARRGESAPLVEEVTGALANLNRGIPGAQDLVAAAGGVGAMLQGRPFQEGYQEQIGRSREAARDFMERRPNVGNLAQGTGAALPAIATMGASAAPQGAAQVTGRGAGLLLGQMGRGAAAGAATGAIYGGTTGDAPGESANERLARANLGGAVGAGVGAAAPVAVNVARGAGAVVNALLQAADESLPRLAPMADSGAGMAGGQMFQGGRGRPPAAPPSRPRGAPGVNTIDRLATRADMTPDQVESAFAQARANPQGQVVADVFGDTGVRTLRAVAQGPGKTGNRAAEVVRQRMAEQPGRIIGALRRGLNVTETRQAAMERLAQSYEQTSANLYRPILQQRIPPENEQAISRVLEAYADDPVLIDATARAQRIFTRDRANGLVQGNIGDNFPRFMHYLKMGLDDASKFASTPSGGAMATELRGIREMRRQIIQSMDDNIPGYGDARARWGGLINAEEALEEGAGFLRMRPEEVRARLAQMTPFEKLHARIGLADEIAGGMKGGRVVGNRNVANALDYRDTQDIIAATFDDPVQAAEFLDTLNTSNELARNALQWLGGSQTYSNAMHGADEGIRAAAEMAGSAATGNVPGLVRGGLNMAQRVATLNAVEGMNNRTGQALLKRVDTKDSEAFARQVVLELRRRQSARNAASRASTAAAAGGGAAAGKGDDRR